MIRAVKQRPEERPDPDEEETEMKLAIRSVFAAALCILLGTAVYAEPNEPDYYYNGPLDSVTGQPVSSASAQTQVRLPNSPTGRAPISSLARATPQAPSSSRLPMARPL